MSASRERLHELAADKVLWGLSDQEERELSSFGAASAREVEELEIAGGAIATTLLRGSEETPPAHVQARLRWAASNFLDELQDSGLQHSRGPGAVAPRAPVEPPAPAASGAPASLVQWSGWLAAAAAVIVAAVLWFDRDARSTATPTGEQLQAFLSEHPDAQRRAWTTGPGGDVVWSPSANSGFLVIDALPVNDRTFQYQLWIFDRGRSTDHPVDGGVFDVTASGRVVIPIDAKIPVDDAFGFAITKERPGGVVVSDRKRIVAAVGV